MILLWIVENNLQPCIVKLQVLVLHEKLASVCWRVGESDPLRELESSVARTREHSLNYRRKYAKSRSNGFCIKLNFYIFFINLTKGPIILAYLFRLLKH